MALLLLYLYPFLLSTAIFWWYLIMWRQVVHYFPSLFSSIINVSIHLQSSLVIHVISPFDLISLHSSPLFSSLLSPLSSEMGEDHPLRAPSLLTLSTQRTVLSPSSLSFISSSNYHLPLPISHALFNELKPSILPPQTASTSNGQSVSSFIPLQGVPTRYSIEGSV